MSSLSAVPQNLSFIKSNQKLNALRIAVLEDDDMNLMDDGIAEVFTSQTDVDLALSLGESYDATDNFYESDPAITLEQTNSDIGTGFYVGDSDHLERMQGQSITPSATTTVTAVRLRQATIQETPSGNTTLRIETDNSGAPSGTLVHANATKSIAGADETVNTYTFPGSFSLTSGVKYWLVLSCPAQTVHEKYNFYASTSSSYAGGGQAHSDNGGATWSTESTTNDLYFEVIGTSVGQNFTLVSEAFTADTAPSVVDVLMIHTPIVTVTLNTDLLMYVSRDNGTTYTLGTLTDEGNYNSSGTQNILKCSIDVSGQPTGTQIRYKIVTANNKEQYINAIAMGWS